MRSLRPLEFAAEVLEARAEPLQLLLDTLAVWDRPGKPFLQRSALLGKLSAPLLKRLVGLPVRPLRPLEFAAKLLAGSRLLRSSALKLLLQRSALLGELGAALLKRFVGLPVRPLRPLEFAAELSLARACSARVLSSSSSSARRCSANWARPCSSASLACPCARCVRSSSLVVRACSVEWSQGPPSALAPRAFASSPAALPSSD